MPKKKGRPLGRQPTVSFTLRLDPETHAALKRLALRNDRTRSVEAARAVRHYLVAEGLLPERSDPAPT